MIDIVFPKDNELEFIETAKKLGLKGLCFVYDKSTDVSKLDKSTKLRIFSASVSGKKGFIVAKATDPEKNRFVIEKKQANLIYALEDHERIDSMHFRDSGLNHILCRLAAENNVLIGFSFNSILKSKKRKRAVILGRMMQNAVFARKFGFLSVIASFAVSPYQMRARQEMISFGHCLGMSPGEAKQAVDNLDVNLS